MAHKEQTVTDFFKHNPRTAVTLVVDNEMHEVLEAITEPPVHGIKIDSQEAKAMRGEAKEADRYFKKKYKGYDIQYVTIERATYGDLKAGKDIGEFTEFLRGIDFSQLTVVPWQEVTLSEKA